jgi:ribosomal protein S18 acetylase RimI-like enzyme
VLVAEPVSPLADDLAVQIAYLHVRDGSRRRGAGRALVAAAAELAGELGAEYVTVATLPHARESQRYFARLGFGPLVVRRAALTSALQLRLARGESGRLLLARRRLAGRRVAERLVG